MKLLKAVTFMCVVCGIAFAQVKVSPVISMTWDLTAEATTAGQRIGVQSSLSGDRYYGIDTNGSDHRTYLGWKFAKLGIGISGTGNNNTYYSIGATYNAIGGLNTDLEYMIHTNSALESYIRLSLVATF